MSRTLFVLVLVLLVVAPALLHAKEAPSADASYRGISAERAARWILEGDRDRHRVLAHLLREAPATWTEEVLREIQGQAGHEKVTRRTMGHASARPTMGDARMIQVDATLIEIDRAAARRILGASFPSEGGLAKEISPEVLARLMDLGPGKLALVSAPRLSVLDGGSARIELLTQTTYVRDYEVETKGNRTLVSPIIETIQDGLVLQVTARALENSPSLVLEAAVTIADLRRPIPEFETEVHGQTVKLQIPELHVTRVKPRAEVDDGGWLVVGGLGSGADPKRLRLVLLQARKESVKPR